MLLLSLVFKFPPNLLCIPSVCGCWDGHCTADCPCFFVWTNIIYQCPKFALYSQKEPITFEQCVKVNHAWSQQEQQTGYSLHQYSHQEEGMVAFVTSVCGQTTTENNSKTNVTLLLYKKLMKCHFLQLHSAKHGKGICDSEDLSTWAGTWVRTWIFPSYLDLDLNFGEVLGLGLEFGAKYFDRSVMYTAILMY